MKWNYHINDSKDSLLSQLKSRVSAIKMIKSKVSTKFAKTIATSIFYNKLSYHVEAYGATTLTNKNKIDRLIVKLAKYLNGPSAIGR